MRTSNPPIRPFVARSFEGSPPGSATVGVEVHGANGYLFTQFLAPADNPRTDAYGGDLAGRARFLRRTVRAVREAVSASFAVGVRLSPVDHWAERGLVLDDGVQVARWLHDDGADFVHLSLGDASGPPPREETDEPVVTAVRRGSPEGVLFSCGGVSTRADAQRAQDAGADVVVVGRASIPHPDWPIASAVAGFEPMGTPWPPDSLRSVDVGPGLLSYIRNFPGFVVGGAPARTP